ncbi:MAG: VOC family protein [Candidatus Taylorbacteria bacterium]|nr:VOC family protein [Candidatus Taylorbacteria bacterium]
MFKNIAFTVYAVTNIKRSRAFYEGVLGLKPNSEFDGSNNSPWVEYNIGEGTISIGCSPDWKPSPDGAVAALEANDFDLVIAHLKKNNVVFKVEPSVYPTCSMAVIEDPDKNKVLIHKKKV